jgi:hypothetical protein
MGCVQRNEGDLIPVRRESNEMYAWAVHNGDVAVPIPVVAWLLGSTLGLLAWVRRKAKS